MVYCLLITRFVRWSTTLTLSWATWCCWFVFAAYLNARHVPSQNSCLTDDCLAGCRETAARHAAQIWCYGALMLLVGVELLDFQCRTVTPAFTQAAPIVASTECESFANVVFCFITISFASNGYCCRCTATLFPHVKDHNLSVFCCNELIELEYTTRTLLHRCLEGWEVDTNVLRWTPMSPDPHCNWYRITFEQSCYSWQWWPC
jgi:hypothetical protein